MKRAGGLPLIVIGAVLILAPVIADAISTQCDKERIARFYQQNPNNAVLPSELRASDISGYDWACFGIGVGIAFTGVGQMRRAESVKSEKNGPPPKS